MHLFVTGRSHCHAPFFASWPEQLMSCPLAHIELFYQILCKSESIWNLHTHTLDLHAKFQPPKVKTVAAKERGIFIDRVTNRPTDRATYRA